MSLDRAQFLLRQGQPVQAEALLRRHIQKAAGDGFANQLMAVALIQQGRADQAIYFAQRSVQAPGAPAGAWDTLGMTLSIASRFAEARDAYERALALDMTIANSHAGLGWALLQIGECELSAISYERARHLDPDNPGYLNQHAWSLWQGWRQAEAVSLLREGVAKHPAYFDLRLQLAAASNYIPGLGNAEIFEHHTALGAVVEREAAAAPLPHANSRDPDRALRVGLLSADFRGHSVSRFVEPLLRSGIDGCTLACFDATQARDGVTARLRDLTRALPGGAWHDVLGRSDAAAAETIRRERIDVLVDLGGHTATGRIGVLAHRPAPVQMTWCGYPNTTGMTSVGWRLVDSMTDPPGADEFCTERLLRLDPCFLCYAPDESSPAPVARAGPLTFGSFNALTKVNDATLSLWAGVLRSVPDSRLLLKAGGLESASIRSRVASAAAAVGIEPTRLELLQPTATTADHLATYGRIDIGLDTFPYHGTTTTCEALWMGVPVVTLAGPTHASRVGASLLNAAGLGDLVASDPGRFAALAAALAADAPRRAELRTGLRERVRTGPLCDGAAFSARLGGAIRHAWRAWCSG